MDFFKRKYIILIVPLLIILVMSPSLQNIGVNAIPYQNQDNELSKKIILFHQGKNQNFNSTILTGALETLEMNNFTVIVSSEPINRTSLTGINVLVIPGSPSAGTKPINDYRYDDQEIGYIKEWLLQPEHGLVLLSNPYSSNSTYDIDNTNLNRIIIQTDLFPGTTFSTGTESKGLSLQTLFPDKYNDPSILTVNISNSEQFSLDKSLTLITKSNSLDALYPMAKAGLNVFGVSSDGKFDLQAQEPIVMGGAISESTSSRLFLIGSALTFSDIKGPDLNNNSWLETADNKEVWIEAIRWVSQTVDVLEEIDTFPIMVFLTASSVILGIAFVLTGFLLFMKTSTPILDRSSSSTSTSIEKSKEQAKEGITDKKKSQKQIKSSRRNQKRKN